MARFSRDIEARLRFYSEVDEATGCWIWIGHRDHKGYGKVQWRGTTWMAYRASYTVLRGPIPEGLEIDHLCRVRQCINPDHLQPVTHAENVARGGNALKTHCPQGHPYPGESRPGRGRSCKVCNTERARVRDALVDEGSYVPDPVLSAASPHAKKTHCPYGHEYTPENTYMYRARRFCRQCNKRRGQEFRSRRQSRQGAAS